MEYFATHPTRDCALPLEAQLEYKGEWSLVHFLISLYISFPEGFYKRSPIAGQSLPSSIKATSLKTVQDKDEELSVDLYAMRVVLAENFSHMHNSKYVR